MDWPVIAIAVFFVVMFCLLGIEHIVEAIDMVRKFPSEARKRPQLILALLIIIAMVVIGSPPVRDKLFGKPNTKRLIHLRPGNDSAR
jgi:amino acid transporter